MLIDRGLLAAFARRSESMASVLQFSTLLHTGLLHDMLCLYNGERQQFHTLVTLGANVCGHPRITHGGRLPAPSYCDPCATYGQARGL